VRGKASSLRRSSSQRQVLFYRDFKRFTGGDLKVWDYFNHVLSSPSFSPRVSFTEESDWSEANPWSRAREYLVPPGEAFEPDVLFLSGVDWRRLDPATRPESEVPIINLVQHVKHACENDSLLRHRFLPHKAIRICVAPEVTRALERTGRVRGPLFTIPDAIDFESVAAHAAPAERELDLLIVANKQPQRGEALHRRLAGPGVASHLVDTRISRDELLGLMGRSGVAVFVPNPKEGFYLPALEAMALGTLVVCPDCIGNRSFCIDGSNCFRPPYEQEAIAAAAELALARRRDLDAMLETALQTAQDHDLALERKAFLEILEHVDELWAAA
jgi:glycosyltransferase involved in cell wall biosynthesis